MSTSSKEELSVDCYAKRQRRIMFYLLKGKSMIVRDIRGCLAAALLMLFIPLHAQDTLRVMHYNLLNYGVNTGFCNNNNNKVEVKNIALRKIISFASPDLFTVNEIGDDVSVHEMLRDSVLNTVFPGRYARAGYSNFNNSYIVNDLYYDVNKVVLLQSFGIYCDVRDADAYQLGILPQTTGGDTTHLLCIVTHLKAGSGGDDEADRAAMVSDILNWMSNQGFTGNCLLMGDFNLKESSEPAWYNLTQFPNAAVRFYDPLDAPGSWTNNPQFAYLHSQSTHSSSNGCAASGGMDDRFDFIMVSQALLTGINGLQYAYQSYEAFGQDGNRFNSSILNPTNTIIPADIAEALYDMSDHLPILIGLRHGPGTGISEKLPSNYWLVNPSKEYLQLAGNIPFRAMKASVYSSGGKLLSREVIPRGETRYALKIKLNPGFYLLRLQVEDEEYVLKAVIR